MLPLRIAYAILDRYPPRILHGGSPLMPGGGKATIPRSPRRRRFPPSRLLPEGARTMWSYTELADPRWSNLSVVFQLRHPQSSASRFKEQMGGIFNPSGWGAYFRSGASFVKRADVEVWRLRCNFEVFTDEHSLDPRNSGAAS